MRSVLALVAAALALIAAGVSAVSREDDVVAFFVILAVVAGVIAVLCTEPFTRPKRLIARTLAVAWAIAAIWIGALLVWYQTSCACSSTVPLDPVPSVSGIPTTLFHLLATYLGGTLVVVATFSGRLAARGAGRR